MPKHEVTSINTMFWVCQHQKVAACHVATAILSAGATFLNIAGTKALEDPCAHISDQGNLFATFRHPSLHRSAGIWPASEGQGCAFFTFLQDSALLGIDQEVLDETDTLAQGQLMLSQQLYPLIQPCYGFINEPGRRGPRLEKKELTYFAWANFFGPEYVEKYTREFLLKAPCWGVQEYNDGGILLIATEGYTGWANARHQKLLDYLRSRIPHIKLYQPSSSRED